jgi:FtsP/CotA-like multicopper oxidase with cupredoxin domain
LSDRPISRRSLLAGSAIGAAGLVLSSGTRALKAAAQEGGVHAPHGTHDPALAATKGRVVDGSIDPMAFLEHFDYGAVSQLPDGRTLREYSLLAVDREIEVAPGVTYLAWTFNGQVPGPTLRATEGDVVRVHFTNAGTHAHTVHFHGIHPANMDGVYEVIEPGQGYTYEFTARPVGLHPYHCHAIPIKRHIARGLYGSFIVDPVTPRPPAREMVMVLNGFDTNFDRSNEVYAVNTVPFAYHHEPIRVRKGELQRIYMVNMLEFDLINSMHLHGNFFHVFRTGAEVASEYTDTLMFCQGERHILEFVYEDAGRFMFHAHQSEFAELGWTGVFDVVDPLVTG